MEMDHSLLFKIFGICCGTLAFLAFLANASVIVTFIYISYHRKFKLSNFIFCFQAITDIVSACSMALEAIFFTLYHAVIMTMVPPGTKHLRGAMFFFFRYSSFLALITLLVITLERFLAVNYPFVHRTQMTSRNILFVVLSCFPVSSIPAAVYTAYINQFVYSSPTTYMAKLKIFLVAIGSLSLVIVAIVYILLIKSYITIKRSINSRIRRSLSNNSYGVTKTSIKSSIRKISRTSDRTNGMSHRTLNIVQREKRKHIRTMVILIAISTIYTLTYMPLAVFNICHFFMPGYNGFVHWIIDYSFALLYYSSAVLNPVITLLYKEDYRRTFFNCFRRNGIKGDDSHRRRMLSSTTSSETTF